MLAIQVSLVGSIVFLIMAYCLYVIGCKKEAIIVRNGVFGALSMYAMVVVMIGLGG